MKAFLIFLLIGLLCGAIAIVSAVMIFKNDGHSPAKAAKVEKPKFKPTEAQLASVEVVNGDQKRVYLEVTREVSDLLENGDFDTLEAMGNKLRKSKAQIANGLWHLSFFYHNIGDLHQRGGIEADWKARQELIQRWVKAKPDSITARMALACFHRGYAWDARGYGFARTVTEDGWRLFRERHRRAKQVLMDAKKLEQKCPMWWADLQDVALAEGWNLDEFNKVFDEAIAFEPENALNYRMKSTYLLPRWYGKKEGVWQQFAAEACDKLGGEAGDIQYARIGWKFHENEIYDDFLKESQYSWPRMKKGMEAIIRRYPDSLSAPSELACLAVQAKDQECARLMFKRIGSKVDFSVWEKDKARFLRDRAWAFSKRSSSATPASR